MKKYYLFTRGCGAHGELQDGRAEHGPGPRHHLQPGPRVLHQPLAAQQVSAGAGLVRTRHEVIVLQVLTALHVRGQSACGHCHICHWKVD